MFQRIALAFACLNLATAAIAAAQAKPRPSPSPFVFNGYFRAYDFTRQNASNNKGEQWAPPPAKYNYNDVNQQSFEAALSAHAAYNFAGFTLGATYLFADPLGPCDLLYNHFKGSPCITRVPPLTNPDDTLPGYQLSTLYEAYAQYSDNGISVKAGNQIINTPWANASDSRVKPAAFQGVDASYTWGPVTVEAMDMLRFESRTSSWFTQNTLLTSCPPTGNTGLPGNFGPPGNVKFSSADPFAYIKTDGFYFGGVGYASGALTADADYYVFENIANALWIDGKYGFKGLLKPFVAVQLGDETNSGDSVIGKIDSQIYGIQAGLSLLPQLQFVGSFDDMPWKNDTITLPTGVSCSASKHLLSIPTPKFGEGEFGYFIPNNAPQCVPGATPGTATVFYGGWASPYTDSYATDPVFTGTMTQTAVDRHIAGTSYKEALVFTSADHRFVGLIAHADYNATNAGGAQASSENNVDALYHFSRVGHGRYRGLLLHYRYGERFFNNTLIYGGLPVFKYNRAQLEYDF
jgi:hypothetical protein